MIERNIEVRELDERGFESHRDMMMPHSSLRGAAITEPRPTIDSFTFDGSVARASEYIA